MIVLLPPSETKQVAFEGPTFELSGLQSFPAEDRQIQSARCEIWHAYQELLADSEQARRVLKLGRNPGLELELLTDRASRIGVAALQRYTGVLYGALAERREFHTNELRELELRGHRVLIQSALFGLVAAADLLPYYRLSASTVVAGLSVRSFWSKLYSSAPNSFLGETVVDFRSQAYRNLTPADIGSNYFVVSVFSKGGDKALNHFNKRAKGQFAAALLLELLAEPKETLDAQRSTLPGLIETAAANAKLGVELDRNQIRLRV